MTHNSYESEWVQNELARAQRKRIPIFPLLLEDEPWLSVESTQYVDVRGGELPSDRFHEKLANFIPRKKRKKISVIIADAQRIVREGIEAILSGISNIEVVGQAKDRTQILSLVKKAHPDIVLLDLMLPHRDGLFAIPKILEIDAETRILVLTSVTDSNLVYQAIKYGALGFISKDSSREQLIQEIVDVVDGQATISPQLAINIINDVYHQTEQTEKEPLSRREEEILVLVSRGLSNADISKELALHERTVAKYISSILDKLHLANRTQAALYAIREGISKQN